MKTRTHRTLTVGLLALVGLALLSTLLVWNSSTPATAQAAQEPGAGPPSPASAASAGTNAAPAGAQPPTAPPAPRREALVPAATPPDGPLPAVPGGLPAPAGRATPLTADPLASSDEVQLSFQGANIEMVVQWLSKTTGKSVVKHPRVQCQLTIVSSKKLHFREAVNLVYRALALEGFTIIESSKSILVVPEGQEPKLSPELVDGSRTEIPEGRQRLVKIFPLKHIQAAELRERIRAVLSDKANVDVADRANQIIVTDYTENIRLLGELIKELDIPAGGDTVIEFFPLKYAEAEELGSLVTLIMNSQPAPPSPSRSSSSSSRSSSSSSSGVFPPGVSISPSPEPASSSPPASTGAGASTGAQAVRIWPDKTSNRLIVAAPKAKLPEVKRLVELLDTEKPQDVSIRVIPLKNVAAEDLVREIGPLFQRMSGKSLKETVEVAANARANSLVILSSESNFKTIEKLVTALDTEEAQEKAMRAFPLKNAEAEDVAKQMQDLHQEEAGQSRYPYYIFTMSSMGGRAAKKPTFVADRRRNTVIVQAPPAAMDDISKLIQELDKPLADDSLAPKIFRMKYVSASDIEEVLNELFLKRSQQRTYWDPYSGMPARETDAQGAGKLAGKVRITSEPYANAIIVTANSTENLAAVEEIIRQLDTPSQAGETTFRVGLRFAKASTVANSLNILFARGGSPPLRQMTQPAQPGAPNPQQTQQQGAASQSNFELEQEAREDTYFPWLGGQPENLRSLDGRNLNRPVSDMVGRVRVVPDPRSNSLLISANLHLFPQVAKLIEELDAPTPQVLIEAKILEVSSDYMDRLGVRWSPDGGATFTAEDLDNSIIANTRGQYQKGFGGRTAVNTPVSGALPQTLTALRSGTIDSTINLDFLVQFLRKTTAASVLGEPQINVADNEVGKLFVGQQVPFIERSQSTDVGALNQTFSYKNVGVILEVTPHINTAGDVALKIRAESSSIVPGQTLFGGAILDTRNFKTDLTVKDGQTLVLGGIIQRQESDTLRKTPILGSIPGLGWAFKKKDKTSREVELMVFLRPRVVRTPEQAKALMEELEKQAPLIKERQDATQAEQEGKHGRKSDR